jgi:hypothetical protein
MAEFWQNLAELAEFSSVFASNLHDTVTTARVRNHLLYEVYKASTMSHLFFVMFPPIIFHDQCSLGLVKSSVPVTSLSMINPLYSWKAAETGSAYWW